MLGVRGLRWYNRCMTQEELTRINLGRSLDDIANLDPRGYGVCRILYAEAYRRCGYPLSMAGALRLVESLGRGGAVYLITGFVLPPNGKAETDGLIGSLFLARALSRGFGAAPLVVCPEEALPAVRALSSLLGLRPCEDLRELSAEPGTLGIRAFTKDAARAEAEARDLLAAHPAAAALAVEAPGANALGVYHNAAGADVSALEAKSDVLFRLLGASGVPTIAVGDLGNEIGMGALGDHLVRYVPRAAAGACACPCAGGIAASTAADLVVTATVSDWACYALCASLAYLRGDGELMQTGEMEREALKVAAAGGLVDMSGLPAEAIDGCGAEMNASIVTLMRELVLSNLRLKEQTVPWFAHVAELGFHEERRA